MIQNNYKLAKLGLRLFLMKKMGNNGSYILFKIVFCFFIINISSIELIAQNKNSPISVKSDKLIGIKNNGRSFQRLIGNVKIEQDDLTLHCDSALKDIDSNLFYAYSNVKIYQGDSLEIYGDYLRYYGNKKLAVLTGNVRLREASMYLRTDAMQYDSDKKIASYHNKATITESANTLTSKKGFYYSKGRYMIFQDKVKIQNPQYIINSDTALYGTKSKTSIFYGPTTIEGKNNFIYCEKGWYNTYSNISKFGQNSYMKYGKQILYADSFFYNRRLEHGIAQFNVKLVDTAQKITIKGQYSESFQRKNKTYITDSVIVEKYMNKDTIFMHCDTIWSERDTNNYRVLRGYYKIKTFSKTYQAVCDSFVYRDYDSIISLFGKPVVWYKEYQATAKKINIFIGKEKKIKKVEFNGNPFVMSKIDKTHYNQIKGKKTTAYLKNNEIYKINFIGNGIAIYFALDDKKKFIGMTRKESSDIIIYLKNRKIETIKFIKEPKGYTLPMKGLNDKETRLKGFNNLSNLRPKNKEDIFSSQ